MRKRYAERASTHGYEGNGEGGIRTLGSILHSRGFRSRDSRLLFPDFAMLFEELVQQHCVHRLIADGVDLSLLITSHQVRINHFYLLGH